MLFDYNYGGIKIIPSGFWPQVECGTETVRFKAHPIICWLAKYFPILPYVEAEYPRMVDRDMIYSKAHNAVFCSHAQANRLKTVTTNFNYT